VESIRFRTSSNGIAGATSSFSLEGFVMSKEEPFENYLLELGRLIGSFSEVEKLVIFNLWALSGIDGTVGRAVFSGTRTHGAIAFIRRVYEAKGLTMNPGVSRAFDQLAVINTARDSLVHWGVKAHEPVRHVSNWFSAHAPRALKTIPMSAAIVRTMTVDLGTIATILFNNYVFWSKQQGFDYSDLTNQIAQLSQQPWRYIPAQPSRTDPRFPAATRTPTAEPPTSHE
jgi:hypothetical protein